MRLQHLFTLFLLSQIAVVGTVERVIDGDTIQVRFGNRIETVRYIGIDTPETVHPARGVEAYGKAASEFNRSVVEGQRVRLEFDVEQRDRYGRLLAYVYTDSLFVNAELIELGYAQLMTVPPNVRYVDVFQRLQNSAREAGRGLSGLDDDGSKLNDSESVVSTPAVDDEITVYITRTGSKYHLIECHHQRNSRIPIAFSEAKKQYEACTVCIPPGGNVEKFLP